MGSTHAEGMRELRHLALPPADDSAYWDNDIARGGGGVVRGGAVATAAATGGASRADQRGEKGDSRAPV